MEKIKFHEMLIAYEKQCETEKVNAYKNGDVHAHILHKGKLAAAQEFRQMMLDGAFDPDSSESA